MTESHSQPSFAPPFAPASRPSQSWQLRTRALELGERTLVMGVVNLTPDSFSDGGRFQQSEQAVEHALRLLRHGAAMVDLGAESTRPGSRAGHPDQAAVSAAEEQDRLLPVLELLRRARPEAIVSVDTYKAATARAALAAGAEIINDVSGFTWDSAMPAVCARAGCGVVLMHTRGRPHEWRDQSQLAPEAVVAMVRDGLADSLRLAVSAGLAPESIVLDPGYGFGKRLEENYALLRAQASLLALGRPLLAGLSRKSFLRQALAARRGREVRSRAALEHASLAGLTAAILAGASIVRVHSAAAAVEAASVADMLLDA